MYEFFLWQFRPMYSLTIGSCAFPVGTLYVRTHVSRSLIKDVVDSGYELGVSRICGGVY